jgi:hypothetical protein
MRTHELYIRASSTPGDLRRVFNDSSLSGAVVKIEDGLSSDELRTLRARFEKEADGTNLASMVVREVIAREGKPEHDVEDAGSYWSLKSQLMSGYLVEPETERSPFNVAESSASLTEKRVRFRARAGYGSRSGGRRASQ